MDDKRPRRRGRAGSLALPVRSIVDPRVLHPGIDDEPDTGRPDDPGAGYGHGFDGVGFELRLDGVWHDGFERLQLRFDGVWHDRDDRHDGFERLHHGPDRDFRNDGLDGRDRQRADDRYGLPQRRLEELFQPEIQESEAVRDLGQAASECGRGGHGIRIHGNHGNDGLGLDLWLDGFRHHGLDRIDRLDVQRDAFRHRLGLDGHLGLDVQRDALRVRLGLDGLGNLGFDLQLDALRLGFGVDGHGLRDRDRHADHADARRVDDDDARTGLELIPLLSSVCTPRLRAGFLLSEIELPPNPAVRLP